MQALTGDRLCSTCNELCIEDLMCMPWNSPLYTWAYHRTDAPPHPPPNPLLLERMPCQTHQPEAYHQFCLLVNSFVELWPATKHVHELGLLTPMQARVAEWVGAGETLGATEGLKRRTLLNILQFVQSQPPGSVTMGILKADPKLRIPDEALENAAPVCFLRNSGLFHITRTTQGRIYSTVITVVDDYMRVISGSQ